MNCVDAEISHKRLRFLSTERRFFSCAPRVDRSHVRSDPSRGTWSRTHAASRFKKQETNCIHEMQRTRILQCKLILIRIKVLFGFGSVKRLKLGDIALGSADSVSSSVGRKNEAAAPAETRKTQ